MSECGKKMQEHDSLDSASFLIVAARPLLRRRLLALAGVWS